ncbi:TniQ family protein [Streptomyces aidingensis]|uniref:TniQ protein n=1 Tax=Streptomyces aidingensis TaxID=910347 RepID=A0A1I1NWA3_9ACTN|nr:TniQ family protein [Streptomyces aidingensis]SFD01954.1 TniQ protein [Streptomyces aidingensis]
MPSVPVPFPGESLASWVDAIALHTEIPRKTLLRDYWGLPHGPAHFPHGMPDGLSDDDREHIAAATGVPTEDLIGMQLGRYTDQRIPALPYSHDGAWEAEARRHLNNILIIRQCSRWCPHCLKDNGGRWLLRWRLAWSFACVEHQVFLCGHCPSCGDTQGHRGQPQARLRCPRTPSQRRSSSWKYRCGHPLTETAATPITDPRLLEIQQSISHGLGDGSRPAVRSIRLLFYHPLTMHLIDRFQSPEMFHEADPALRSANNGSRIRRSSAYRSDVDPLVSASALYLADQLIASPGRVSRANAFADLAHARWLREQEKGVQYFGYMGDVPMEFPRSVRDVPPWVTEPLHARGLLAERTPAVAPPLGFRAQ